MLTRIKRQECLVKYRVFPLRSYNYEKEEEEFYSPRTFKSYIFTLASKSFKGHIKLLGTELTKLTEYFGSNGLIFLGDNDLPWLNQENDYKPAKEAQQYLSDNKVGSRFNGALLVGTSELPTFTKHISWLIRCNASLPYFHFIDNEKNILGNICQYGNLHLYTLKKDVDKRLESFRETSKLTQVQGNCFNNFGKTSAIKGRQIIL